MSKGPDNTIVRRYSEVDIPYLVKRLTTIIPTMPNYKGAKVDPSRLEFMLTQNVNNDGYFMVFVLVNSVGDIVGGICAYCVTMAFSWDRYCSDMFLYIDPNWRSLSNATKLIRAYQDWGISRKAMIISATYTGGGNDRGMDRLLRMVGFTPIGKLYHLRRDHKE